MVLGISQESLLRFLTVGWLINCFRDESISRHDIFDLFPPPERINFYKVGVNITYLPVQGHVADTNRPTFRC